MESQPQNPEFRNNPENPCIMEQQWPRQTCAYEQTHQSLCCFHAQSMDAGEDKGQTCLTPLIC